MWDFGKIRWFISDTLQPVTLKIMSIKNIWIKNPSITQKNIYTQDQYEFWNLIVTQIFFPHFYKTKQHSNQTSSLLVATHWNNSGFFFNIIERAFSIPVPLEKTFTCLFPYEIISVRAFSEQTFVFHLYFYQVFFLGTHTDVQSRREVRSNTDFHRTGCQSSACCKLDA